MCGRYTLSTKKKDLTQHFDLRDSAIPEQLDMFARYNIAPTQPVPIVRMHPHKNERQVMFVTWGLIPPWAKEPSIGSRMINARCETLLEKNSSKNAYKRRRCLIPATGFYEWHTEGGQKQPYLIQMADESLFAMAGLWEHWQSPEGSEIESCTIITTAANELLSQVHHRMPVIIDSSDYDLWLQHDHESDRIAHVAPLLVAYPGDAMTLRKVSTHVSNARNDDPRCLQALTEDRSNQSPAPNSDAAQGGLFDGHA